MPAVIRFSLRPQGANATNLNSFINHPVNGLTRLADKLTDNCGIRTIVVEIEETINILLDIPRNAVFFLIFRA